jgi:hypothetical protein
MIGRFAWRGLLVLVTLAPTSLSAQGIRGSLLTTARYIQLQPLDTLGIPRDSVTEIGQGQYAFGGAPAYCITADRCMQYRAGAVQGATVLTQDLGFTAWGLGMQGLSATVQLRGRANGGAITWPQSDHAFDAILAYLELNRSLLRLRLGRLRTLSGLGFAGYDGADIRLDPIRMLHVEAYGGRSLARGLEQPVNDALQGIEAFVQDQNAYLMGGALNLQPIPGTALGLRYQREVWADGSGLLSERASADFQTALLNPVQLDAAADYDFAFGRVGKAHVTARVPVRPAGLIVEVTGRRYVPYFDLWTIWGMFGPVAYNEGLVQLRWSPLPTLDAWGMVGMRKYDDTSTPTALTPLQGEGRRVGGGARIKGPEYLTFTGSYNREWGNGAAMSSGSLAAVWSRNDRLAVTVRSSAFQQVQEFRVGQGMVLGIGGSLDIGLTERVDLSGGADLYRQTFKDQPGALDWNQLRGWMTFRIGFGEDPGMRQEVGR